MTRVRSLYKEKADMNQLRHHRNRNIGHSVSTEFYQPCPFFFTRESSQVNLVGNYRGSSAFLICNGPSLASGDYDLSLMKLPGVMTMGINNGAKTLRPNFWTCVDDPKRFLLSIWLDPTIKKIVPHAHAEKRLFDSTTWQDTNILVGQCPNVIYYHRNAKFHADRWLYEDTINWGNTGEHGGCRSVMLPALRILFLLGFRRVYLMGADFIMSENYTYHFDEQRAQGAVKCNLNTYQKMKDEYFPALKPYFDAEGFEVYNCNQNSGLAVFPYMPYEQAISECTSRLGDIFNERTWGMYSKPEERQKWKQEPDSVNKSHLVYLQNSPETTIYAPRMEEPRIDAPRVEVTPIPQDNLQQLPQQPPQQLVPRIPTPQQPQQPQYEKMARETQQFIEAYGTEPPAQVTQQKNTLPPPPKPIMPQKQDLKAPPIPRAGTYQRIEAPEEVMKTMKKMIHHDAMNPPPPMEQRQPPVAQTNARAIPRAPIPPMEERPQPRQVAPTPIVNQRVQRPTQQNGRVINKLPCGVSDGSSGNYRNNNITIEDDGK